MMSNAKIIGDGPVVMVDDNGTDAYLAQRCYERSGIPNDFIHIYTSAGLIDLIGRVDSGEEPMPALVLLDINMPDADGFEVLASVRNKDKFRDLPIIVMLTTSDDERDSAKSEELGANAFFTKPSRIDSFVEFFRSLAA